MLTLDQVKDRLRVMNLKKVSRETHIDYMQIWKLFNDKYASAPYEVVKQLSDYLESM